MDLSWTIYIDTILATQFSLFYSVRAGNKFVIIILFYEGVRFSTSRSFRESVAMDKKPKNGEKGSLVNAGLTKGNYEIGTAESGNAVDDIIDELPEF
ncbi:hypothetical protein Glove_132g107 [Diversispora epigaea]|uniref:Uncharacterized protein n=1 Tax=Diversispora epigaea TaxID=1348612 RepID=A0A397J1H8_9GLOM|nr:hypothetical protein Glove_132g107 [Diversispora epigaea]